MSNGKKKGKKRSKYDKHLKNLRKTTKYDCWNLDQELAIWLLPRIKLLREIKEGISMDYFEAVEDWDDISESEEIKAKEKFDNILITIEAGLKVIMKDNWINGEYGQQEIAKETFELIGEHLHNFWT